LIKDENNVILGHELGLQMTLKSVRHLNIITIQKQAYLLITYNNEKAEVYQINNN